MNQVKTGFTDYVKNLINLSLSAHTPPRSIIFSHVFLGFVCVCVCVSVCVCVCVSVCVCVCNQPFEAARLMLIIFRKERCDKRQVSRENAHATTHAVCVWCVCGCVCV